MFNCSRKSSLFLLLLTVLVASYPSGDDSSEDDNANNSESDQQQVVDELERRASRNTKCPGCKTLLSAHAWGAPSRLCVGEETVASNSDTRRRDTPKNSKATKSKKKSKSKSRSTKHTTDLTSKLDNAINCAEAALRQSGQDNQLSEDEYLEQLRALERELQEEERSLKAQDEIRRLERRLEDQQNRVNALRNTVTVSSNATAVPSASLTDSNRVRAPDVNVAPVPLDGLIGQMSGTAAIPSFASSIQIPPPSSALHQANQPSMPDNRVSRETEADVFLRPASSAISTHGKPLRIPDYVSRLMPQEDRRVLSTADGQASFVLECGTKKPKLDSISLSQWNTANYRIFNELISRGRLSTPLAVREYLSYSIKIMELTSKYTWSSILKYDDEFRVVQSVYGYAWSQDHYHLHEVILRPLPNSASGAGAASQQHRSSGNGGGAQAHQRSFSALFGSHTSDGSEICKNFNALKGCSRGDSCHFKHVCNRKTNNRVCEGGHRGCHHASLFQSQQPPQQQ